jgi:hypothetical protein
MECIDSPPWILAPVDDTLIMTSNSGATSRRPNDTSADEANELALFLLFVGSQGTLTSYLLILTLTNAVVESVFKWKRFDQLPRTIIIVENK